MLKKQLEEGAKEKQELLISHSREVISLRQEIMNLKIIKQRKEVLEQELRAEKRQNDERRRELEKERTIEVPIGVAASWAHRCGS